VSLRLALVDDQALVREGLKSLLRGLGFEVVVDCEDGAALMAELPSHPVQLILSDVRMPRMDGIELTRRLRSEGHATPIILLTTFDDDDVMLRAIEAGAQAFLLKDISPEDLRDAVLQVARGELWLAPVSTAAVRRHLKFADTAPPTAELGARELGILRLMAGGYSNKEIARSLFLAEGTVKNYVSEILEKLGTRDRTRAVLKAITLRLI
jgi:DNA-binding NarL/FixJ family response regulator